MLMKLKSVILNMKYLNNVSRETLKGGEVMNLKSRKFLLTLLIIIFSFAMLIFKKKISSDEMEIIKNCIYMAISYILGESYVDSKK